MKKLQILVLLSTMIILSLSFFNCKKQTNGGNENIPDDTSSTCWVQKASMIDARSWNCVGVVNGKIYAIGGNMSPSNSVEEYNPITDKWTIKSPMSTGRSDFSGSVINNKIYVTGGWMNDITLSSVEESLSSSL